MSVDLYARIAAASASPQIHANEATVAYGADTHQRFIVAEPKDARYDVPVVFFHGGGWSSGSALQYRFAGRTLARWGFTGITAGYRLVPGHTFPAQRDDALAVIEAVLAEHSPSGRVIVGGFSAGAHLAALVAYDASYRQATGVSDDAIAGVFSLAGIVEFGRSCGDGACEMVRRFMGGPPPWDEADPITYVTGREPWPFLAIHGARDDLLVVDSPRRFVERVSSAGGIAELAIDSTYGHADVLRLFLGQGGEHAPALRAWLEAAAA